MRPPRDRLAQRQGGPPAASAAAHKRWSLPVLYMRPEELRLHRSGDLAYLGEFQTLRSLRGKLSKDTPPEILAKIDSRIAWLAMQLPL